MMKSKVTHNRLMVNKREAQIIQNEQRTKKNRKHYRIEDIAGFRVAIGTGRITFLRLKMSDGTWLELMSNGGTIEINGELGTEPILNKSFDSRATTIKVS